MAIRQTSTQEIERCPSALCGRPFQVNRFQARLSVRTTPGEITCPHCGLLIHGPSDSIFLAHALLPSEEVAFIASEAE